LGRSQALASIALVALCAACTHLPSAIERPFRVPGEKILDFPAAVATEFDCAKKKLPWFKLEKLEVWPKRLAPGGELGHRLVYVLCTAGPTDVVTGPLVTRVLYRGEPVLSDTVKKYDLRPGRWQVDVFVKVPATAPDGLYALELGFAGAPVRFKRAENFAVEGGAK
jgi:hypothetical protein